MEITLIRHGRPTFELKGVVRSRDVAEVIRHYDMSDISDDPPKEAKEIASTCNVVVCSDFCRSVASAKSLGFNEIHISEALFREVALPHFKGGQLPMPVVSWAVILRGLSIFGFSRNGESLSMAKNRAKVAASRLIDVAQEHNRALLVGHGIINHFIAKELLNRGWVGPSNPGRDYWGYGVYEY